MALRSTSSGSCELSSERNKLWNIVFIIFSLSFACDHCSIVHCLHSFTALIIIWKATWQTPPACKDYLMVRQSISPFQLFRWADVTSVIKRNVWQANVITFLWAALLIRPHSCVCVCALHVHTTWLSWAVMWSVKLLSLGIDYLFSDRNAPSTLIGTS